MRKAAGLPVLGAAAALLAAVLIFSHGSSDGRLFWIGAAATLLALALMVATLVGALPRPSPTLAGRAAIGLVLGFALWNGMTMAWSVAADRSWAYLDRGLVYVAFALVGLYVGTVVRRPVATTAGVLAVLVSAALGWALLGKVFPGLFPDGARVARLRNPVGYWNALALVAAVGLLLALWLASGRRHHRVIRAAGVLMLYGAAVALVLTFSRAGIVVAAIGLCVWLVLCADRFEGLLMLAAGLVPAAAVCGWAAGQPGLVDDLQSSATRERAGGWFVLALVLGAAAALGLAHLGTRHGERLSSAARHRWAQRLGVGLAVAAVVAVVSVSAAVGGPGKWLDEFRGRTEVVQGSGRLTELSSNNRWAWWKESWHLFRDAPLGGHGARTFEIARRPLRQGSVVTVEPHSIALQALAEMGIVGLLLGGGAALLGLLACWEALQRLEGEERAAAVALAVALPVYLLHALADIDWDFAAATAPVFLVCGCLFAAGREPKPPRTRPLAAAAAGLAGLAVLYSLTAPWLADRKVEDAYAALGDGDAAAAVSASRQAHQLNPFSTEPLWAWALADTVRGDVAGALRRYRDAADLQPENSETWYSLGAYEYRLGRYRSALRHLDRAWGLDRYGPAGIHGGLLDQARAKVQQGGTG